jgi:hypothetical protein
MLPLPAWPLLESGSGTGGSGPGVNALLWDDGTELDWDDGTELDWDS